LPARRAGKAERLDANLRAFQRSRRRGATGGPAATGARSGRKPAKSIDDERVRDHLCNVVRGSVEETLNAMLETDAERLCNAGRYDNLAQVRGILTHGGFRLASLLQRPAYPNCGSHQPLNSAKDSLRHLPNVVAPVGAPAEHATVTRGACSDAKTWPSYPASWRSGFRRGGRFKG
jgi:hypothetical protein